jgi:L-seryl-tRNA(Ser) seleniumtransferase
MAVEKLLVELTGAEAATVVNNNAGATLLTLSALGAGREVIVSRGQLVEIGGSYRLPDVMAQSGARLREVGTTNKTRISDYEQAINENTAALMRVHTSNYRIVGFTESPALDELVSLARRHHLPVIDDIGSGALFDFSKYGLAGEPVARDSVQAGADVILFSGDKLLGGPQCGIIVGRRQMIERIIKHPFMRALRVDKTTLAGLAATLRLYRKPELAEKEIPLLSMLATSTDNLKNRAERLAAQMKGHGFVDAAEPLADASPLGGGSIPTQMLDTWCIGITPKDISVDQLARRLRLGTPAVFGRVKNDRLMLDLRSVRPGEDMALVSAVTAQAPADEADD